MLRAGNDLLSVRNLDEEMSAPDEQCFGDGLVIRQVLEDIRSHDHVDRGNVLVIAGAKFGQLAIASSALLDGSLGDVYAEQLGVRETLTQHRDGIAQATTKVEDCPRETAAEIDVA